jgi:hypothetical protein
MTTVDEFRTAALAQPEAVESEHMGHPDFRVRDKIFASLPSDEVGVVKLPLDEQAAAMDTNPDRCRPAKGLGRHGWTELDLDGIDTAQVADLLQTAWCVVAPRRLVDAHHPPVRGD